MQTEVKQINLHGGAPPRQKRRKRKPSRLAYIVLFVTLAVCACAVFIPSVFKVKEVKVSGNAPYTAQQVTQASGIKAGDGLFAINKANVVGRICSRLPNIGEVKISLKPLSTVEIRTAQAVPRYILQYSGGFAVTDNAFRVLETRKAAGNSDTLPLVVGVQSGSFTPGARVSFKDSGQAGEIADVLTAFSKSGMGHISQINITDRYQISALYDRRITILLGTSLGLDEKLRLAKGIIGSKLQASDKGTLDVSSDNKTVIFTPS